MLYNPNTTNALFFTTPVVSAAEFNNAAEAQKRRLGNNGVRIRRSVKYYDWHVFLLVLSVVTPFFLLIFADYGILPINLIGCLLFFIISGIPVFLYLLNDILYFITLSSWPKVKAECVGYIIYWGQHLKHQSHPLYKVDTNNGPMYVFDDEPYRGSSYSAPPIGSFKKIKISKKDPTRIIVEKRIIYVIGAFIAPIVWLVFLIFFTRLVLSV